MVIRIVGIVIPSNKRLVKSLPYIYGIGDTLAKEIVNKLKLDGDMRAYNLTDSDISRINHLLESSYVVEGTLKSEIRNNKETLKSMGHYKGVRPAHLPVNGQKTRRNSRTRKGKKKTIANKKKAVKK